MNILILDFECTISNKGNPFDKTNKAVCLGLRWTNINLTEILYYPFTNDVISYIQEGIDQSDLLVAFNAKFDLHWLRRLGISFEGKRVWCCQLAEFILNNQKTPYPSLDQAAEKYDLQKKLDVVKLDYWNKGIDTDQVPRDILSSYCSQDLILTEQVFLKQKEQFDGIENKKLPLFKLQCQDLLVLAEMEENGIKFDVENARKKANEIEQQCIDIYKNISSIIGDIPINLNSGDHLSCLLYGGTIYIPFRIPVGVYKSGGKTGQIRYKIVEKDYMLPRLVEPLEGTEVKKPEGSQPIWQTNVDVLRTVKLSKEAKVIVNLLKEYTKLEKLRGTYLLGWSDLIDKMNWRKGMIHGTLNQCTAITGRLSSSKPNLQNADSETKRYCVSRYDN